MKKHSMQDLRRMFAEKATEWAIKGIDGGIGTRIADEAIEAFREAFVNSADAAPVAEAASMPGTGGFTMACFRADEVPVGTPIYAHPAEFAQVELSGRIEALRKGLFEARDAMRVMSNWVKTSDPAGHSWAVHMVDKANAVLSNASAATVAEPSEKLNAPAQVGNTVFGKGVEKRLVIEAAQRNHQRTHHPTEEDKRIAAATESIARLRQEIGADASPVGKAACQAASRVGGGRAG
ncbi:hypothetical protein PQ43W_29 [Ralstonia phage PQ43W]